MADDQSRVSVGLSEETKARITLLAARTGLNKADVIAHAVHLAELVHDGLDTGHKLDMVKWDESGFYIKGTCKLRF
jgi:hypothetical protein